MTAAVALAATIVGRAPALWVLAAAAAGIHWLLVPILLVAAVARARRPRPDSDDSAEYFDAVSDELRRGASLRQAVAIPAGGAVSRAANSGQPMEHVATAVSRYLGSDGELAVPGILIAAESGAPAAGLFSDLAARVRDRRDLDRERTALTAQVRFSAAVVVLIPIGFGVIMLASGRGAPLTAPGPTQLIVAVGLGLQLTGAAVVAYLLRQRQ